MPQPPDPIELLHKIIDRIGQFVYENPLTVLFVLVAFIIVSLLPQFISVSLILLVISVAVYLYGH